MAKGMNKKIKWKYGIGIFALLLLQMPMRSGEWQEAAVYDLALEEIQASASEEDTNLIPSAAMVEDAASILRQKEKDIGQTAIATGQIKLCWEDIEYLEEICYCIPYFDDRNHLDDNFYARLVNGSICGPMKDMAESISIENHPYYMAKISRADMENYMELLFGIEMPPYEPSFQKMQGEEGNFYYEDGFYYIGWYDPLDIAFTYVGYKAMGNGEVEVEFAILVDAVSHDKSLILALAPAENENGFLVTKCGLEDK